MAVFIQITQAGPDQDFFEIRTDADGFITPIKTGVRRNALLIGYEERDIPSNATVIRLTATGACTNSLDVLINKAPTDPPGTTTTTSTTTVSPGTPYSRLRVTSTSTTDFNQACSLQGTILSKYYPTSAGVPPPTGTTLYNDTALTIPFIDASEFRKAPFEIPGLIISVNSGGVMTVEDLCPIEQ